MTVNLVLRFFLEMTALVILGVWGWNIGNGVLKVILAVMVPVIAAAVWGVFAVPDDPSRSGNAPIIVPGIIRIILELVFFTLAAWALYSMGHSAAGWLFGVIVVAHYLASHKRVSWLLHQ